MIRVLVNGVDGQMGRSVVQVAKTMEGLEVVAGVDKRVPEDFPFPVYSNIADCNLPVDVIIDFSRPEALESILAYAKHNNAGVVVATTGMTDQQFAMIESYSHDIPVFQATNLSLGLNLMLELVEKTAGFLGGGFDVEIIEKHHNRKVDAPSGTALVIAETINRAQGNQQYFTYGRHTKNQRRSPSEIGIHAIRGGTIVGEHEALFIGNDETLSIKYSTASRQIYAMGALRAGAFLVGRPPRRYNMSDLLLETSAVTTVMMDSRQAMVTVHRVPADPKLVSSLFTDLAHNNVNVDMISQTAPLQGVVELSFTLPESDLEQMRAVMETYRQARPEMELTLNEDVAKITIEGQGMQHQTGVAAKVFQALAERDIAVRIITTSETKIACMVDRASAKDAVAAVSGAFGL